MLITNLLKNYHKKILFITIFIICILYLINQSFSQISKDYLYKYNQLYNNPKFNTKIEPYWKNVTATFKCEDPELECSSHGVCAEDKLSCICDDGYLTLWGSYVNCTYKAKSKVTAVLLETFIGFGIGHLYCKRYMFFIGKFLFFFFSCYFNFCLMIFVGSINNSNVNEESYSYTKRTTIIIVPIMVAWYFMDIILFMMGNYTDNNDMPLI